MEATFYDDSRYRGPPATKDEPVVGPRTMKRPMTLDLDSSRYSKKQKVNTLLTSPDLHMLKIASPELERMIIAQHGLVSSTPSQCMYPSKTTGADDREYHTRDFADALTALQPTTTTATTSSTMYHPAMGPDVNALPCAPPPPSCSGVDTNGYYQQPTSSCTNNVVIPSTSSNLVSTNGIANCYPPPNYYMPPNGVTVKEEPQTVPCMGVTPPLSPIDMENQEKIKLERKRLRNRIAASKCRRRKLERIARLESKVAMLKGENAELTNVVSVLREQVCSLKQQVMDHVRCGCEILNFTTDLTQY